MRIKILLILVLNLAFCEAVENWRLVYPDFDLSLSYYGNSRNYRRYYLNKEISPLSDYIQQKNNFQSIYEADREKSFIPAGIYKIPRIIHQIWLGGELPEKYQAWVKTWQNWEGWDYYLWTDHNIHQLALHNAELYTAATNYGEKSDILRYEILLQLGGLYVDIDAECVHSDFFQFAHQNYSFYAAVEPVAKKSIFLTGNAILASAPGHPLMKQIVTRLPMHIEDYMKKNQNLAPETVKKTGPYYLHQILYENKPLLMQDGMIFPPTFFFPPVARAPYLWPETVAIHYWDGSWSRL